MKLTQTLKRTTAVALVGFAVFISGCASNDVQKAYYEALKEQAIAQKEIGVAQAQAEGMRYYAISKTSDNADSTAKAAIGVSLSVANSNTTQKQSPVVAQQIVAPETTQESLRAWAGIALGVGGLYVQDRNGERSKDVQIVNSNNSASVQMSTNGTMLGLGLGKEALSTLAPLEFTTNSLSIKKPLE